MANLETGMSTDNTLGRVYQVFLSFRGPDTRRTFTDFLRQALVDAGIHVFIDDEGLQKGERISGDLPRAIDDSKLYIPIFSKNYASSHWCLKELAMMVENTSKNKEDGKEKVILPIFYDVKPNDVKLETPLYRKAISDFEDQKFSSMDIEKWQQALKEIGGIAGWELEKYTGPAKLIQVVVDDLVDKLKTRQEHVTRDLVGMGDQIADIEKLLEINSGDVRLIGIYGMAGVGKTTLAKIIFNRLCPRFGKNCSFLDDVGETAKTKGLLVNLQIKLLRNISNSIGIPKIDNMDQGTTMIRQTICNKKMLIVLDDVDEGNQIQKLIEVNSLYPGTIILVTTRNKSVLKIRGSKYEFVPYRMDGLSKEDALKLFSRHAFNKDSPPTDYYTLSKDIVSTAGGLPLALEAIGSNLFVLGQEKTIWKEMLEQRREKPPKVVLEKLRICFDTLEPNEQHIFLDVACFFNGWKKTDLICSWKYCGVKAECAIHVLIDRCMIKVLEDDQFQMPDQFRDLGREIAREQRTRLWDGYETIYKLRSKKIKKSVQALCLQAEDGNPITVKANQLRRFPNLKFLWLNNVICKGDFTGCLSKLKWIVLWGTTNHSGKLDSPTNFGLENVVVMNISFSRLTKDEIGYLIKGATKLKCLTHENNVSIFGT